MLPADLIRCVCDHLELRDLKRLRLVSRHFERFIDLARYFSSVDLYVNQLRQLLQSRYARFVKCLHLEGHIDELDFAIPSMDLLRVRLKSNVLDERVTKIFKQLSAVELLFSVEVGENVFSVSTFEDSVSIGFIGRTFNRSHWAPMSLDGMHIRGHELGAQVNDTQRIAWFNLIPMRRLQRLVLRSVTVDERISEILAPDTELRQINLVGQWQRVFRGWVGSHLEMCDVKENGETVVEYVDLHGDAVAQLKHLFGRQTQATDSACTELVS